MESGHFAGANNVDIFRYVDFIFQGFLLTKTGSEDRSLIYLVSFCSS